MYYGKLHFLKNLKLFGHHVDFLTVEHDINLVFSKTDSILPFGKKTHLRDNAHDCLHFFINVIFILYMQGESQVFGFLKGNFLTLILQIRVVYK